MCVTSCMAVCVFGKVLLGIDTLLYMYVLLFTKSCHCSNDMSFYFLVSPGKCSKAYQILLTDLNHH